MPRSAAEVQQLRERVAAIGSWYHRIDLGDGIETPGPLRMADYLSHYHLPEDLSGKRVLDVGASTGFFSYEFERRGAAEVVAVELPGWDRHDWTPRYRRDYLQKPPSEREHIDRTVMRDGFELVGQALGSQRVRRVWRTIYELDPAELGHFDLVFCGAMLMHVRDPVLGLQRLRACLAPTGRLIVSISEFTSGTDEPVARFAGEWDQCNWWQFSGAGLERALRCSDFDRIEHRARYVLRDVNGVFEDPTFVCHAMPRASGAE